MVRQRPWDQKHSPLNSHQTTTREFIDFRPPMTRDKRQVKNPGTWRRRRRPSVLPTISPGGPDETLAPAKAIRKRSLLNNDDGPIEKWETKNSKMLI